MSSNVSSEALGKTVADALRAVRAPSSQTEAAIKCGLLQSQLAKIESGRPPSLREFISLAAAWPALLDVLIAAVRDAQNRPAS
jgi:transcriptional regulator with XRE-family HTH domain